MVSFGMDHIGWYIRIEYRSIHKVSFTWSNVRGSRSARAFRVSVLQQGSSMCVDSSYVQRHVPYTFQLSFLIGQTMEM